MLNNTFSFETAPQNNKNQSFVFVLNLKVNESTVVVNITKFWFSFPQYSLKMWENKKEEEGCSPSNHHPWRSLYALPAASEELHIMYTHPCNTKHNSIHNAVNARNDLPPTNNQPHNDTTNCISAH